MVPPRATADIGIVSDTPDDVDAVERATEIFAEESVAIVVHCGDFGAPLMGDYFEEFEFRAMLGNEPEIR